MQIGFLRSVYSAPRAKRIPPDLIPFFATRRHLVSEFPRSSRLDHGYRQGEHLRSREPVSSNTQGTLRCGEMPHCRRRFATPSYRPPLKIPTLTRVPPTFKGNAGMAARLLGFGTTRRRSMPTSKVCCDLGYTSCASACDCRASSSGQRHRREHRGAGTGADGRA